MTTTLHVCTTCRAGVVLEEDAPRPGAMLYDALVAAGAPEGVEIVGVKCLSACSQGASVALSEPGKWSYVYGRLSADDTADILAGAAAYAPPKTVLSHGANALLFSASNPLRASPPLTCHHRSLPHERSCKNPRHRDHGLPWFW